MRKHFWKATTAVLLVVMLGTGIASAVDGLWIPLRGNEAPADGDIIVYNDANGLYTSVAMSGGANITNAGVVTLSYNVFGDVSTPDGTAIANGNDTLNSVSYTHLTLPTTPYV